MEKECKNSQTYPDIQHTFFNPDYTVGFGLSPNPAFHARGLYRRSGISPCPEDIIIQLSVTI